MHFSALQNFLKFNILTTSIYWHTKNIFKKFFDFLKIIAMLSKSVEHIHSLNKSIIVKLNFFFRETKIHNSVWRNWIMLMVSFMPEWNHASFSLCFKPIYKFSKEFWRRNSFDNFWSIQQNLFQEVLPPSTWNPLFQKSVCDVMMMMMMILVFLAS